MGQMENKPLGSILIVQIDSFEKQLCWKLQGFLFKAYTKQKAGTSVTPLS